MYILIANSNLIEGLIVAAKYALYMIASAAILFLVLTLTRFLGKRINDKLYAKYKANYIKEHNSEDGMLTLEDFVLSKKNIEIIDRQDIEKISKNDKHSTDLNKSVIDTDNVETDNTNSKDSLSDKE